MKERLIKHLKEDVYCRLGVSKVHGIGIIAIKDIPKGKAVYRFESVDIHKAKDILGDTVCFRGNIPVSLLIAGTTEKVKAYIKELIDVTGKDGGLIVDCGSVIDEAKHDNIKAMVEFTKEYGRYK